MYVFFMVNSLLLIVVIVGFLRFISIGGSESYLFIRGLKYFIELWFLL